MKKLNEQNIIYWIVFFLLLLIGFVIIIFLDIFLFSNEIYSLTFGWILVIPFTSLSVFVIQLIPYLLTKYSKKQRTKSEKTNKVGLTVFFTFVYVSRYFVYVIPLLIAIIVNLCSSNSTGEIFNIFTVIAGILCVPLSSLISNLFWLERNVNKKIRDERRRNYEPTGDSLRTN